MSNYYPMHAGTGSTAAGYWGDYVCDVPYHTLENMMESIVAMKDQVNIAGLKALKFGYILTKKDKFLQFSYPYIMIIFKHLYSFIHPLKKFVHDKECMHRADVLQHLHNPFMQFDWIYMTGDLPAHNVWNQSRDDQLFVLEKMTELLKKYLPDKVVFPTLGNHESAPVNR